MRGVDRSTVDSRTPSLVVGVHRAVPVWVLLLLLAPGGSAGQVVPPPPGDSAALQAALAPLQRLAAGGGWGVLPAGPSLRPGESDPRVGLLRRRLEHSGDLAPEQAGGRGSAVPDSTLMDSPVVEAVRRFQSRHGLDTDGVVGPATRAALNVPVEARIRQVELNLRRRREWSAERDPLLSEPSSGLHILVNVPAFQAWVLEEGSAPEVHRVIVGRVDRPTPLFEGRIQRLALAPYWNVPPSIALRDKLPLLRRDPAWLARQRMTVMDRQTGRPVSVPPSEWNQIDPAEFNDRFWLRQDPGPGNALGQVKFIFPNPYEVYLHDTPDRHLFERGSRTFSSGCIRLDRALELAERLLADRADWPAARIRAVAEGGTETWVELEEPVPIRLVYWTAWVDGAGVLHLNDDVYGLDALGGVEDGTRQEITEPAGDGGREMAGECR